MSEDRVKLMEATVVADVRGGLGEGHVDGRTAFGDYC